MRFDPDTEESAGFADMISDVLFAAVTIGIAATGALIVWIVRSGAWAW